MNVFPLRNALYHFIIWCNRMPSYSEIILLILSSLEWPDSAADLLCEWGDSVLNSVLHRSWLDVTNSCGLHDTSRIWWGRVFFLQVLYVIGREKLKKKKSFKFSLETYLRIVLYFTGSLSDPFHSSHHLCYAPETLLHSSLPNVFLHLQVIAGWLLHILLCD